MVSPELRPISKLPLLPVKRQFFSHDPAGGLAIFERPGGIGNGALHIVADPAFGVLNPLTSAIRA
jgi:hypothetical protein